MTNGPEIAVLVHVTARFHDRPDEPVVDQLHVPDESGIAAALRSVLHHAPVLLRCGHELPPFINAVRERLFHIYILARLAGPHCSQRVPVIRCRNRHCVNLLVL